MKAESRELFFHKCTYTGVYAGEKASWKEVLLDIFFWWGDVEGWGHIHKMYHFMYLNLGTMMVGNNDSSNNNNNSDK